MTLEEVKKKLEEILTKLEGNEDLSEEEITALENEAEKLEEEKKSLIAKAEKRSLTLKKIKRGLGEEVEINENKEERKMNQEEDVRNSKEYRSAFLKKLQRKELTDEEERALTTGTSSVGAVIPTITQNLIIEKVYPLHLCPYYLWQH